MTQVGLYFTLVDFFFGLFIIGMMAMALLFIRAVILAKRTQRKGITLSKSRPLNVNLHRQAEAVAQGAVGVMNDQAQQMASHMQQEANHQTTLHTVMQQHRETQP
jgi:hypothetical protein